MTGHLAVAGIDGCRHAGRRIFTRLQVYDFAPARAHVRATAATAAGAAARRACRAGAARDRQPAIAMLSDFHVPLLFECKTSHGLRMERRAMQIAERDLLLVVAIPVTILHVFAGILTALRPCPLPCSSPAFMTGRPRGRSARAHRAAA